MTKIVEHMTCDVITLSNSSMTLDDVTYILAKGPRHFNYKSTKKFVGAKNILEVPPVEGHFQLFTKLVRGLIYLVIFINLFKNKKKNLQLK